MQGENGSFGILRHSERCRRFIPFWAVYEILLAFINQNVTLNGILIWCLVGAAGYLLRVAAMESLRSWRIFQPIPFWKESGLKLRTG